MEVYIEAVIADNFFITFLAAALSYRILGVKHSLARTIAASAAGTAAAVFYPFIDLPNYALLILKIVLCAALSCVLFLKKCSVLKGGGIFLMVTFFFGGALFCLSFMIYADVTRALTQPVTNIPIGALIAVSLGSYLAVKKISARLKRLKDAKSFIADIELELFGKTLKGRGFLDTGNRLYDSVTGLPVVIVSLKAALCLLDEQKLSDVISKKGERISRDAHYIDYSTLGTKNNSLLVLKPDELRLYSDKGEHRIKNVAVGLTLSPLTDVTEYEMILHPAVLPI